VGGSVGASPGGLWDREDTGEGGGGCSGGGEGGDGGGEGESCEDGGGGDIDLSLMFQFLPLNKSHCTLIRQPLICSQPKYLFHFKTSPLRLNSQH
jgi:hypothetical protein